MATPKQLVEKIAELTGVPLGTVTLHDRNLLVAGLRSEGQRGRGTSVATYQDAANLLMALAASRNVKDSAETVRLYAPLRADEPLVIADVVRGQTFGDALAALIETPTSGPLKVELLAPWPLASISFRREPRRDIGYRPAQFDPEMASERSGAMLKWTSWFTEATIYPIGYLLRGG